MKIGVISDTHGLFREELNDILKDVDRIIHLGDIGSREVISKLENIAETDFIIGNVDKNLSNILKKKIVKISKLKIYMIHNIKELKKEEIDEDIDIIAYGHSHKPNLEEKDGIIYLNPGSIGRRRFELPISYGIIDIDEECINIKIYDFFSKDILYDKSYYSKSNGV